MNRFKRWIHKDRYGIVRSGIIICMLLLACLCVLMVFQQKTEIEFNKERSAHAAEKASFAFEQMIHDAVSKLEGAAEMLSNNEADEKTLLNGLVEHGRFSKAAVQRGGVLYFANGSYEPVGNLGSYAARTENGAVVFFASHQDTVRMSMQSGVGEQLVVWLDAGRIADLFNDAAQFCDYAIYNNETGSFLLNSTAFEASSYYDALLRLNNDGRAEELLSMANAQVRFLAETNDNTAYYIAQRKTDISPWSIVLIIQENMVVANAASDVNFVRYAFIALLLVAAVVICNTLMAMRRIKISRQNTVRALAAGDQLIQYAAGEMGATVFMYNRVWDRILSCYNGLSLGDGKNAFMSFGSLAECCSLQAGETDLIYDSIGKLVPGEKAEITLHSSPEGQEERLLRCILYACDDGSRNIICLICDATQQQAFVTRADIEKDFMASVQRKASAIWQVNISRNRWKMITKRKNAPVWNNSESWRDYSEDLRSAVREMMHPADYNANYEKQMDIDALADAFRMGKTEFTCEYRVMNRRSQAYEWHRMQVRLWLDVRTNDIIANLYAFDVNAKKNAELELGERKRILKQAVTALGGMYSGLYYVDLENDLSYTARSFGGELVDQLCQPYKASFDEYINAQVHPEDREALRKLLSAYNLRRNMTEGSHFQQGEFRRIVGGERYVSSSIIVQPARFENGSVKEVVLAIRDIER